MFCIEQASLHTLPLLGFGALCGLSKPANGLATLLQVLEGRFYVKSALLMPLNRA